MFCKFSDNDVLAIIKEIITHKKSNKPPKLLDCKSSAKSGHLRHII